METERKKERGEGAGKKRKKKEKKEERVKKGERKKVEKERMEREEREERRGDSETQEEMGQFRQNALPAPAPTLIMSTCSMITRRYKKILLLNIAC